MSVEAILDRAFAPLQAAVEDKRIPGGVLGVVDRDGTRAARSIGSAQLVPAERPMTDNTWFDLASLTKVIFTTPRILALAEAGTIDLDAPLTSVIPDFRQYNPDNSWERKLSFRQCLGHQTQHGIDAVFLVQQRHAVADRGLHRIDAIAAENRQMPHGHVDGRDFGILQLSVGHGGNHHGIDQGILGRDGRHAGTFRRGPSN